MIQQILGYTSSDEIEPGVWKGKEGSTHHKGLDKRKGELS